MSDILIRTEGRAGRITLNRPAALNALTHDMALRILAALDDWQDDPGVALVLIDAAGDRAFCAGGDIAALHAQLVSGQLDPGRAFWRDEYRMNARIAEYPKPVVTFLQGFTMGGGVGVGCHAAHRIVGETSRIAMPECSIGLVPDVGGTHLLARAPGRLGEFLGLSSARMTGADAILAGFADHHVPQDRWPALAEALCGGDVSAIAAAAEPPPPAPMAALLPDIDRLFAPGTLGGILDTLRGDGGPVARDALDRMARNAPLAMAAGLALIAAARAGGGLRAALAREYRYVHRAVEQGDFAEGIRARIVDKDNAPRWHHGPGTLPTQAEVQAMTAPLGAQDWSITA